MISFIPSRSMNYFTIHTFVRFPVVFMVLMWKAVVNTITSWSGKRGVELVWFVHFSLCSQSSKRKNPHKIMEKYNMERQNMNIQKNIWKLLEGVANILNIFIIHTLHGDHVTPTIHSYCCLLYIHVYCKCMGMQRKKAFNNGQKGIMLYSLKVFRVKVNILWKLWISNTTVDFQYFVIATWTNVCLLELWSALTICTYFEGYRETIIYQR